MNTAEQASTLAATTVRITDYLEEGDLIGALMALHTLNKQTELLQQIVINTMRADGYSWDTIGSVLGTSRQAAHQRYATRPA